MNHKQRTWIPIAVIIVSTLACAMPGLSTPVPFNTLDPNSLSTAIAATAGALATQTAQAAPVAVTSPASPGENPGLPTSASTSTMTPRPVFSAYGTAFQPQADGSTIFIDQQAKFNLVIPPGWTAFRINEPEFFALWQQPISSDPVVQRTLTSLQSMDPSIFRLFAFDLRPGHMQNGNLTNIDVMWSQNVNTYTDFVHDLELGYERLSLSHELLGSKTGTTSSGVEINITEFRLSAKTQTGATKFYEKIFIFKASRGLASVRFDTDYSTKDLVVPELEQIKNSIQLLSE